MHEGSAAIPGSPMNRPVIAILLDACEPAWLERWLAAGELPTLALLRDASARVDLDGVHPFTGELPTHALLTATLPWRAGYWGAFDYDKATYSPRYVRAYDYRGFRNFYDYDPALKVCQFDLPKSGLARMAQGIQVLNWGAHSSLNPSVSNPPSLFAELEAKYGLHPALEQDHLEPWQTDALDALFGKLAAGVRLRTRIHRDLLARGPWDLFLIGYSEIHSSGHCYMHVDNDEYALLGGRKAGAHMLALAREIDASIADLLAAAPADAGVALFSIHGMVMNGWDIDTMFILPELLHRLAFPERIRAAEGALPAPTVGNWYWADSVWAVAFGDTRPRPRFEDGINWIPATWYAPDWPSMRAFALPGLDEGMVRLNVSGRDPHGIVAPADYEATLAEIATAILGLRSARTGKPLARRLFRTRSYPQEDDVDVPPADLIVDWSNEPCDVADSPAVGRIGPVPLRRTGGHSRNGFAWFRHPQMARGERPRATPYDIGPTLLDMIGAPIPSHLDGRSLFGDPSPRGGNPMFREYEPMVPAFPSGNRSQAVTA